MRIKLHLDKGRLFRWHLALAGALSGNGHQIAVQYGHESAPLPASLTAILDFDRARGKAGPDRLSTRLSASAFAPYEDFNDHASLTIDLATSDKTAPFNGRVLRPEYDGSPKDTALFHALLARRAPHLIVRDVPRGGLWQIGLPAIELPTRLAPSLDQTVSRLVEGLVRIVTEIANGHDAPTTALAGTQDGTQDRTQDGRAPTILQSAGVFAAQRATRKVRNIGNKITGNAPRWHVAWRATESNTPEVGLRDASAFQILGDCGQRYFADPFIFVHGGGCHVFVEEVPSRTGVGIISHLTISEHGHASAPRPVLDTGQHLSYPQVFAHDGQIWMLPESVAAGGLDLYRAEAFPDRWVKHARLIGGRVHDATFFEHGGLLWIAAGSEAFQSSSWDALSLFYAEQLTGPWRPHPRNPVIVDSRCSRPAGPLWSKNGQLYRPAQDCSNGYGGKISVRCVAKLSPDAFSEEEAGGISFRDTGRHLGPHTIHCAGGIEVVDLYARPRALTGPVR